MLAATFHFHVCHQLQLQLQLYTSFEFISSNQLQHWVSTMKNFESLKIYRAKLYDFFKFHQELGNNIIENLLAYFEVKLDENGDRKHCAKSLALFANLVFSIYEILLEGAC